MKKRKIDKPVLKRLFTYIAERFKKQLFVISITIIISSICHVYGQVFIEKLIDTYISPLIGVTNPDYHPILMAILWMAFVYGIGVLATFLYNRLTVTVSQGVLKSIRKDMFTHMEELPVKYFDDHTHGDIMSYYINDTDALREMVSQTIPNSISNIFILICVFVAMVSLNIPLTIFMMFGVLLMVQVAKYLGKKSSTYFIERQKSVAKMNGYIEEMIAGQKVVKVFNHEEEAKKGFDRFNEELYENTKNANTVANTIMPIMANIGYLLYVLIAIVGGIIAIKVGTLSIGAIASFLLLTRSFTMHINQLSQQVNSITLAIAGAGRIFHLLDEVKEQDEGKVKLVYAKKDKFGQLEKSDTYTGIWAWFHPNSGKLTELKGVIQFIGVDFSYVKGKEILKNIDIHAKMGEKVALVGATGAGKTTITNLLTRFYEIDKGTVLYDGIDIKNISKKDLRTSLGMVLQESNFFTGTIMENLRYGRLSATDEECIAASKLANADAFIRNLPSGYDTILTDNAENLSQGQRQLLAIARCAVSNPPVMILDEATSSIDTKTEREVQEGMDKLMEGRTVFVIAHRLSTVQNANTILVLENGKIIERGSHEELLKEKGKYYELYTGVFELE